VSFDASNFGVVGIVGATGLVGAETLDLLARAGFPAERVRAFASSRSAGARVAFGAGHLSVARTDRAGLLECDQVVLAADAETARTWAPFLRRAGVPTLDHSSAFRLDPDVPLVVPEVNGDDARGAPLVANPNCSTILLTVALEPLRVAFGLTRVSVATYQAVSGAGKRGLEALNLSTRAGLADQHTAVAPFPEPIAFNVQPHESPVDPHTGLNGEETKLVQETQRLWRTNQPIVAPTCVRVPTRRAHAQAIEVELSESTTLSHVRGALEGATGLKLWNEGSLTPQRATGLHDLQIGRLRPCPTAPRGEPTRRYQLWLCGDQLLKGAALNGLQVLALQTAAPAGAPAGPPPSNTC
jgi:aspartate-semialdehyde dehydrogenase